MSESLPAAECPAHPFGADRAIFKPEFLDLCICRPRPIKPAEPTYECGGLLRDGPLDTIRKWFKRRAS